MKKRLLPLALIAAAALTPAMAQNKANQIPEGLRMAARGGAGPVMSASADISSLPAQAQAFLMNLFPDSSVVKVENDFADREYGVDMSDGYEVTFDYDGKWLQVDAPDGATLPSSTLTALVPEEAVLTTIGSEALLRGGATDVISEITVTPQGYIVEYVTGTVGKGKANISKSDGSIILKAKKDNKVGKGKLKKVGRHNKHAKLSKQTLKDRVMRPERPAAVMPLAFVISY